MKVHFSRLADVHSGETESEQLSELIGCIYDAALKPELWPQALELTRKFAGGFAANIFWQDLASNHAGMAISVGDDPRYRQSYIEKYAAMNPLYPSAAFFECGTVFSSADILPLDEIATTQFYKEWQQPQGIVDGLLVNLEKSATVTASLAVVRGAEHGLADESSKRRMSLIVPHMMRAISIGHVIEQQKLTNMACSETMSMISSGVFMVDGQARIAFANDAARGMTRDGTVLRDGHGMLHAADAKADRDLHDAIVAAGNGDIAIGIKGVAVPLSVNGNERWLAHVLPLTSGARREAGMTFSATVAIFVRKTGFDTPSALETLSKLYPLTASEVRVLQAITDTGGVPAVAQSLGISTATVKTHLDNLFAKTGARRQADLVKLVAGAASPIG